MLQLAHKASRRAWKWRRPSPFQQSVAFYTRKPRVVKPKPTGSGDTISDKWNYNKSPLFDNDDTDLSEFELVNANSLEHMSEPPRKVKMLARDFIEDSLYNPHYGYFSKQATIFNTKHDPVDFCTLRDSAEFSSVVTSRYTNYGRNAQLWHTPTELFRPFYAHAIARCLVAEYLLKYFPYEDFHVYEIGAGNGSLALDILDYIQVEHPDVYERTRYTIVEISAKLANQQRERLKPHHPCATVVNRSIFRWRARQPAPCFFIAMEVIDNFAHDIIRYDMQTLEPYQGMVSVDDSGDFDMHYTKVTDPLIRSFLSLRRQLGHPLPISSMFQRSNILRKAYSNMPFAANMSVEEYIPTRLLTLVQTLRNHFPRHRLLLSDFYSLPDTIPGVNAPVVQTRYQNNTIPCSQLLVQPGAFDIFFPTNFEQLRDMYEYTLSRPSPSVHTPSESHIPSRSSPLTSSTSSISLGADFFYSRFPSDRRIPLDGVISSSGLPVGEHKSSVFTHAEFLETYADLSQTKLRNGENPMMDFYKNVKVLF